MFGRLLKRLFRGRERARPVNPLPPPIPPRPADTSLIAPPPPPPVPAESPTSAPVQDPLATQLVKTPVQVVTERDVSEAGRVRFVLEDGTMASPVLDPDLEERLKYIVDNIVPPSEPPTT